MNRPQPAPTASAAPLARTATALLLATLGPLALATAACPGSARRSGSGPAGRAGCADRCALPRGLELTALAPAERAAVAARALLCADYECGRLTREEYVARVSDGRLATAAPGPPPAGTATIVADPSAIRPASALRWAAGVVAVSSEYAPDSWSARSVLGPPDVWPTYGDDGNAWASAEEDGGEEYLELSFAAPAPIDGLEIYETYNPGAIVRIEAVAPDGRRLVVYEGKPAADAGGVARVRAVGFSCTPFPVHSVKLTLDSKAVPGWNEIDAVGAHPCERLLRSGPAPLAGASATLR